MAKTEVLFTLEVVTDTDTGDYRIGEIDFGIRHTAYEYVERNGYKGLEAIYGGTQTVLYLLRQRLEREWAKYNHASTATKSVDPADAG